MDDNKAMEKSILVVDDEPSICEIIARVLKIEGYNPMICNHPFEALEISGRHSFGLAFIDINLPEMSGLDLASRLKKDDPFREIVFITGFGTFDSAVQAIKIGAYDYLRKPFSITEINLCLRRFQEREALKNQVKLAEQRYFQLVQNVPLLIFEMHRDFSLAFVNNSCGTILGYSPLHALNEKEWLLKRIHPEDRKRIRDLFENSFQSKGKLFSVESRLVHKKGYLIHAIIKAIPKAAGSLGNSADTLEGIIVDITDRVLLEKALVQKEKLKTLGAISAEVAHEIRNPLVSLGGFARRLKKKFPDVPECKIILNESKRLEKILDRIRNYLKPVEFQNRECYVNSTLKYCLDLMAPEIESKNVDCLVELDQNLPYVFVDPEVLTQVFINLIRNGLAATEKGESLIIKTFESDQNVHTYFKNQTCSSKKQNDTELLFLPFDEGGQSIGLPLSYRLVKSMGGVLSVAQEKEAMIFTVSLPKAESRSQA